VSDAGSVGVGTGSVAIGGSVGRGVDDGAGLGRGVVVAGSVAVAVAVPRSGAVTVCVVVAPGAPATASVNPITAPAVQPPVLMLTSNRV
jgi:hypothetical protein